MQFTKLNYHRFIKTEPIIMETKADTKQARSEIEALGNVLTDTGKKVEYTSDKISKSMGKINVTKDFRKIRRTLESNITNSFSNIQAMINKNNTSKKFNIDMQAEMDKFAVSMAATDHRKQATQSEINNLIAKQATIMKRVVAEEERLDKERQKALAEEEAQRDKLAAKKEAEHQKEIASMRKVFEQEEKTRLEQEKRLSLTKEINMSRNSGTTSNIFTELKGGVNLLSNGVNSISNGFSAWIKHLTGVAVTFRILGGVVSGIVGSISSLYETAAGYQEAMNLYNTALGSYVEKASEWRDRISKALYLDPKQIMQYTGALYNLVQGLGATEDAAYTMSTNLTQLAYDMSSYLNIDVQSAYDKIQSAITGQSRAVAGAGVAMQQAALQEKLYNLGINESIKNLNQAEKTYLRYIQIMDSTKNMQMDLGKTIITPENALRTIKTQFTLLAREIGNVFVPIVLKAVPYVMALTQALSELAKRLAAWAGFEISDINYDNAVEGTKKLKNLDKGIKSVGSSAKATKNQINRTLAAFDDLNVVESKSTGGGAGGSAGGGGGAGILDQLEGYLTGYDMLGKLNDQFKDKVAEARKNLEKLWNVVKVIGVAFAAWKLLKLTSSIMDFASALKLGFTQGKGFGGVIKTLVSRFSEGYKYAKALGGDGLGAIQYGLKNMLGPLGTVVSTLALMAGSFLSASSIMKTFNGETDDLIFKLIGTGGVVAAFTAVAAVALGPWAGVAVAVAGVIGAIVGLDSAMRELRLEEERQAGYADVIQNGGIAISGAYKLVEDGIKGVITSSNDLQKVVDGNDSIEKSWDNAKEAFEKYQLQLSNGEIQYSTHKEMVDGVTSAVDKLKNAGNDRINNEKVNELEALRILKEETNMTEKEYNERKKAIEDYYAKQSMYNNGYYDQYKKLLIQREEGTITEKKFREEVEKLQKEYLGLTDTTAIATEKATNYLEAQNGKIDLESPEKLNEIIQTSINKRKEYIDQEYNSHQKLIDQWKDQKDEQQKIINVIEEEYGAYDTLGEKQKQQYDDATARIKTLSDNISTAEEAQREGAEKINATYKNFLGSILLELSATGRDQSETFRESVGVINGELQNIGKDVDPSKSATDFMGKYANTMTSEGKTISADQQKKFYGYGIDIVGMYGEGMLSETGKAVINWQAKVQSQLDSEVPDMAKKFNNKGAYVTQNFGAGMTSGFKASVHDVYGAAGDLADCAVGATCDRLQINSPSKVTQQIGQYFGEGFANGIDKESAKIESSAKNLSQKASKALQSTPLSLNINTNIESSLNSMLNKLQKFCNNWRNAINKLASGMKSTMNSIKIDKDGKVTYNSMPDIHVSKFKNGGFPTSGDLFFANENGVPEYITSVGNRSAVANQDQMISALSGAIITAMSRIPTNNQPSNITVYVGDKKLYEGQGEYQNRQNDRYGTTIVKI